MVYVAVTFVTCCLVYCLVLVCLVVAGWFDDGRLVCTLLFWVCYVTLCLLFWICWFKCLVGLLRGAIVWVSLCAWFMMFCEFGCCLLMWGCLFVVIIWFTVGYFALGVGLAVRAVLVFTWWVVWLCLFVALFSG